METIAKVPDAISRAAYLRQTSVLMEMGENVLLAEMNKILRSTLKKQGDAQFGSSPSADFDPRDLPPEIFLTL